MSNLLSYRITLAFAVPPHIGEHFTCIGHHGIERQWEISHIFTAGHLLRVKAVGLPYYDNFKYKISDQD